MKRAAPVPPDRARGRILLAMIVVVVPLALLARHEAGLYRDAETMYRATIARHPDSWLALANLGMIELDRSPAQGVARLREALAINPDFAEAQFALGRGLQMLDRNDEAIAAYREAARLRPRHAKTHDNLGSVLAAQNRLSEAETEFRTAIELAPGLAGAHTNLGIVLAMSGKTEASIAAHREAIRLAPDLGMAHANLGNALYQAGRFSEAAAAYREAQRILPEVAELRPLIERADAAARAGSRP